MINNIPVFNIPLKDKTSATQLKKVIEEHNEVIGAYTEYIRTQEKEHLIEELIDSIQANYTMLRILGVKDTDFEKHITKKFKYDRINRF